MYHVLKNAKLHNCTQNTLMFTYGMFITAFTTAQFIFLPIYCSSVLKLSYHKCLGLSSSAFPYVFVKETLHKEHKLYVQSLKYFPLGSSFPIPAPHRQDHLPQNQQFATCSAQ